MVTSHVHKILFVELLGGIGDVLIALPAIQAFARSHPKAELTVLTLPPGGELLESDPLINQVVYADSSNPRKSVEVLLARHTFDVIVSDIYNTDALAAALLELLNNPVGRSQLGEAGCAFIQNFSWQSIAKAHRSVYGC